MLECLMAMLVCQWDVGHSWWISRMTTGVCCYGLEDIEGIFHSKFDVCFALLHRRGVHNSQPTPFLRMGPMGPSKEPEWSSPRWLSKTMFPMGFKLALGGWDGEIPSKSLKMIWPTRFQSAHLTKTRPTFLTKLWKSPLDLQFAPGSSVEVHL